MGTGSSKEEEKSQVNEKFDEGDMRVRLIDKKADGSRKLTGDHYEKGKEFSYEALRKSNPSIKRVPKAIEGEQIAAGWPTWLASVAGEAINGWIPRRAYTFEKLEKIGQGTYSNVYKARDITNGKIVAIKKIRCDHEPESVKFMAREILILRRLDHPNVIKLEGLITSKLSACLYLVFEYMEHDLTGIASLPGVKFTESQVKCYMHQLLTGLEYCHSHGVLHRDIKCSNLLLDNNGKLKIADFGLSTFFDNHQNIPLTSRVVTLWYRPPELLLGKVHYGVAVDLWSTGCVLGELYAGKPIMPGRTEVEQLHKIYKLCGSPSDDYWRKSKIPNALSFKANYPYRPCLAETFKDISPTAFSLLATLLSFDPESRGTAASALQSEFFKTEPLACDPSSLPKYPPSKEAAAKFQEGNASRSRVMGAPRPYGKDKPKNLRTSSRPDANAGLASSTQFFTTKPFARDPKSSPKYSPSKEVDAPSRKNSQNVPRFGEWDDSGVDQESLPEAWFMMQPRPSFNGKSKYFSGFHALKDQDCKLQDTERKLRQLESREANTKVPASKEVDAPSRKNSQNVPRFGEWHDSEVDQESLPEAWPMMQPRPSFNGKSKYFSGFHALKDQDCKLQDAVRQPRQQRKSRAANSKVPASRTKAKSKDDARISKARAHGGVKREGFTDQVAEPRVPSSYNVDELLEEHDRQIQEAVEKKKVTKRRVIKIQAKEKEKEEDNMVRYVPILASLNSVDELLEEHVKKVCLNER